MTYAELDLTKKYSYADYLKWTFQERLELFRGKILKMSPAPNSFHQILSGEFFYEIRGFLGKSSCKVFNAPFDVRFPRRAEDNEEQTFTVLQPDICVVCDTEKIDKRGCKGAPDLIVEILSPGNTEREMNDKFDIYEESGVREYWIVEPRDKIVFVYVLNENRKYVGLKPFTQKSMLTSVIFPDFSIKLSEIFDEL